MPSMNGKICVVTGANSGIGKETVNALAQMDATVIMVVRDLERGEQAKEEILQAIPQGQLQVMLCDLSSIASVRAFTVAVKAQYDHVDVLINNAGAFIGKHPLTVEGFDETFAVNYLGPFLLTIELLPLLKRSASSRIINVSSGLQRNGTVNFNDLQSRKHYRTFRAYANAKVMLVLFTYALAHRLENTGITVNALQPGFVATNLGKNWNRFAKVAFGIMRPFQTSAAKGAETSIYLATSPEVEGVSGRYFSKKQEIKSSELTYDSELQEKLWMTTLDLLGINDKAHS